MNTPEAVILDDTALLALGGGNRMLSSVIVNAQRDSWRHVYVPTLCPAAAEAKRSGVTEHVGSLPAADLVELDFSGGATVGGLIHGGATQTRRAVELARPRGEWPHGRAVLTREPEQYEGTPTRTIQVPDKS